MRRKNLAVMLIAAAMFVACSGHSGTDAENAELNGNVIPNEISYGTLTDSRDGKTYKTVTIGSQTWMAENLNYDYNEGSAKSYCYNNSADSCSKYGRLYMWSAAMDSAAVFSTAGKGCGYGKTCASTGNSTGSSSTSATLVRGVCPEGWHLPSYDEWNTLFTAVGETSTAGTKLKSTSGWNGGGNGTGAFGFSGLPAGSYDSSGGYFCLVGNNAYFWSSTEYNSNYAYNMDLYYGTEGAYLFSSYKLNARSVRCLLDS